MRTKYKQWAVDYLKEGKNILSLENSDEIFSFISERKTFLEIGPGKGDFILDIAKRFSDHNFLLVEINPTISGILLKKIDQSELTNIRLISCDFFKLKEVIKDKSFDGIFLNFSDPWPKKRHEKRRLTSKNFLEIYHQILKDDGKIYFKTDNFDFFLYSLESFQENKFKVLEEDRDYKEKEDSFDSETEFEKRFKEEGIKINRLVLEKE